MCPHQDPFTNRLEWVGIGLVAAVLGLMFLLTPARAATLDLSLSAGIGKSVLAHEAFERYGALGVEYGSAWRARANAGYWFSPAPGTRSSPFLSFQGGPEIVSESGFTAAFRLGPAWIAHPDSQLSGHWQFHMTFGAGLKDRGGRSIRAEWNHWSNAGLKLPNMGRDILVLSVTFPVWGGGKP